MAAGSTRFQNFIAEEIEKYQGNLLPVKASLPERILVRSVSCDRLHPNPYDEFSMSSVGPNYEIISDYVHRIKEASRHQDPAWDDPVLVEKMYPKDYMILNGHHRWAACMQLGVPKIKVRVVNLTQETDIRTMISNSQHDRRVTLDLDEVVFCEDNESNGNSGDNGSAGDGKSIGNSEEAGNAGDSKDAGNAEKALPFPFNRIYKERLRQGIPALFHFLSVNGYDIWVYTRKYYSLEYIRKLFRRYHVHVNGIVTGIARTKDPDPEVRERVVKLFENTYKSTLHIDRETVTLTNASSKEFEQYDIKGDTSAWSREVMNLVSQIKKEL